MFTARNCHSKQKMAIKISMFMAGNCHSRQKCKINMFMAGNCDVISIFYGSQRRRIMNMIRRIFV